MPGMELTADTFRQLESNLDYRQQIAVRAALGNNRLGLLPGCEFNCSGVFVRNNFEVENFICRALIGSGRIINVNEDVSLPIPMLYGDEYYLCVGITDKKREFEKEGVPYIAPVYSYSINTLEELKKKDFFPVLRFKVSDGLFSLDDSYIVPSLYIEGNKEIEEYKNKYIEQLENLAQHANLIEGDGKRTILRYVFILKTVKDSWWLSDFVSLTEEIAHSVEYFIIKPNTETSHEIPVPEIYDVEKWLKWLEGFLTGAISILDKVVLEDNSIDYEALLAQAKQELLEKLQPELFEKLPNKIKEELYNDIIDKLKEFIPEYLNEKIETLRKEIGLDLERLLEPKLFDDLYKKLYDALYVAPEEEDEFMPMI